ncbi:MAG: protein kinase [Syntrophobacter sp.]
MITPDALIGKEIDEFRLDEFIAAGAMGLVYKAHDTTLNRTVALKLISKVEDVTSAMAEARHRLITEARAAAGLFHDNIVTIFSYGETDTYQYIAMEFVEGKTLAQVLAKRRTLSPKEAIPIFDQILQALEAAHAHDIIHRDIKPANIMVTEGGRVKVMDFGIAKIASHNATATGMILGTPQYMAPEQIRGAKPDSRSDIFAVGVILYEVLTGVRPFEADAVTTLMYKILEEEPVHPSELNRDLPRGLGTVIRKSLAKDPADRWQTTREMRLALLSPADEAVREDEAATIVKTAGQKSLGVEATAITGTVSDRDGVVQAGTGSREIQKKTAETTSRKKSHRSLQWFLLAVILILAASGVALVISQPLPQKLLALRLLKNGQEFPAPAGSTVTLNPRDTLHLLQVQTDGWLPMGIKVQSSDMDAELINKKTAAIRDLFPRDKFDTPKSVDLKVTAWDRFIGKVTLVVQLDATDWQMKANIAADTEKIFYLEKALHLDNSNVSVKAQLADLYFDKGRYSDAIRLYQELNEYRKSQSVTERLIKIYQVTNRVDDALALYIDLLKLTKDRQTFNEFISYLRRSKSKDEVERYLARYQNEIPAAFMWSLAVQTNPGGATVFVNGILKGLSPVVVSGLNPGSMKIRVTLDGYKSQEKDAEVVTGKEVMADFDLRATSQAVSQSATQAPPQTSTEQRPTPPAGQTDGRTTSPGDAFGGGLSGQRPVSPLQDRRTRKPVPVPDEPDTSPSGKQMYAVHVGSYRDRKGAEEVQRNLAKKGIRVVISPSKDGSSYNVSTPPVDNLSKASTQAGQMKRELKQTPKVVRVNQ